MRAGLVDEWPALTHLFPGLLPWHIGGPQELTWQELQSFRGAAQALKQQQQQQ